MTRIVLSLLCALVIGWTASGRSVSGYADPFWGNGPTRLSPSEGAARGWNWEKAQSGNTHPGAVLPFDWVSACPYSGGYPTGYGQLICSWSGAASELSATNTAFGISHFQHSGTGWISKFYNYLLVTPFVSGCNTGKASVLADETARPGYYAARLADYGVSFELVPRRFAACHRYRYEGGRGNLLVDATSLGLRREYVRPANYGFVGERVESFRVAAIGPAAWTGTVRAHGRDLHFAFCVEGRTEDPFCRDGAFGCSVIGDTAEAYVGFSLQGVEEARQRAEEARKTGFDASLRQATADWESELSRVQAFFRDARDERVFYSALYQSMIKPVDCGGAYVDFSTFWDIYRTELPLILSLNPEVGRGILEHIMSVVERLGFAPVCQIMDDSVVHKDVQATALPVYSLCDGFFRGLLSTNDYPRVKRAFSREFGHADIREMSPTHALDLSGAYAAAAYVATSCQDRGYAQELIGRQDIWRSAYDGTTGLLISDAPYYEGNHWNYSFRPHPGMNDRISIAGGERGFLSLLDKFFAVDAALDDWSPETDRIRRVGRFEGLNNEADMDAPFAYLWCGRSDRLSEMIDLIRRCRFSGGKGGCPGNNDSGATGSWYVWSCLGLYPLTGTPYYLLGSPSVDRADIRFRRGTLTITVRRESEKSIYPHGYERDGRILDEPWIEVSDLERGGSLVFRLGDRPCPPSTVPRWL